MKVIHIVESLDNGAVENWLVRMFLFAKKSGKDLEWTFFCTSNLNGKMETLVKANGAKVIHSKFPLKNYFKFIFFLRKTLRRGNYDVIHCHHDLMSAIYLISAFGLKAKKIVHVHNMDEVINSDNQFKIKLVKPIFRRICFFLSDKIIGISNHTLDHFILYKRRKLNKHAVHYYGVDGHPFEIIKKDTIAFRKKNKLKSDSIILLFCGRIDKAKNPLFAIDVLTYLVELEPRIVGYFVGRGSLEMELIEKVKVLKLTDNFFYKGWSNEIPEIMTNSDLFISPHVEFPMEGLGLVVVEAQVAGLPILISQGISNEAILLGSIYRKLSLSENPRVWAENGLKLIETAKNKSRNSGEALKDSVFDMDYALNDLMTLHNGN